MGTEAGYENIAWNIKKIWFKKERVIDSLWRLVVCVKKRGGGGVIRHSVWLVTHHCHKPLPESIFQGRYTLIEKAWIRIRCFLSECTKEMMWLRLSPIKNRMVDGWKWQLKQVLYCYCSISNARFLLWLNCRCLMHAHLLLFSLSTICTPIEVVRVGQLPKWLKK